MKKILIAIALAFLAVGLFFTVKDLRADPLNDDLVVKDEDYWTQMWCYETNPFEVRGDNEVILEDRGRIDCVIDEFVIEFDWPYKYQEAIGQCLRYSLRTGKRPGIVLLMRSAKDEKYWKSLQAVILKFNLPIQTWKMKTY